MATLDRRRPYGETWGSVGLQCYDQDGRRFGLDGRELATAAEAGEPVPVSAGARRAKPTTPTTPAAPQPTASLSRKPVPESALAEMPDNELRAMVEIAGGTWSGRVVALAFLASSDED